MSWTLFRDKPAEAPGEALPGTEQLYHLYARKVAGWATHLLGPGADVDDIVHEVFLIVQRRLADFRHESKVSTWLYEITLRVVRGWRRRQRWRRWLGLGPANGPRELATDEPGPLQVLESRQATQTVYRILGRLPERDRTILILFEIEELSGQEIADVTGASLSSVWVRLHRARARFLAAYRALEEGRQT